MSMIVHTDRGTRSHNHGPRGFSSGGSPVPRIPAAAAAKPPLRSQIPTQDPNARSRRKIPTQADRSATPPAGTAGNAPAAGSRPPRLYRPSHTRPLACRCYTAAGRHRLDVARASAQVDVVELGGRAKVDKVFLHRLMRRRLKLGQRHSICLHQQVNLPAGMMQEIWIGSFVCNEPPVFERTMMQDIWIASLALQDLDV